MGCVKEEWVPRGSIHSTFNPTMTVHCGTCHYSGALVTPEKCQIFLALCVH